VAGGPATRYGDHALGGVYYALVTQNDDPDGPGGRVKLRYPWMPEGDRDQSYWAPVCVPMIGDDFGTYTLPEVNDEVLVVFMAGDLHHPVVIGGAWSQQDPPPEDNRDGKNDFRLIKSRAGHRLILDDSSSTKVVLTDQADRHLVDVGTHGAAGSSPNAVDVPALGSAQGVSVAAMSGALNVWCPSGTLTVKAMTVEVTASGTADLKGGTKVALEGATGTTLSATVSGKYQGGSIKLGAG
jgi:phage baseplate assembly protein gpV